MSLITCVSRPCSALNSHTWGIMRVREQFMPIPIVEVVAYDRSA